MKKIPTKIIKKIESVNSDLSDLIDLLDESIESAREYFDNRSEKWQEENGHYEDFIASIETMREIIDQVVGVMDEIEIIEDFEPNV